METEPFQNRDRGQAAVETALVMPLFVFIILGTLQLNLMNQAKLLTKYAAYKAARVGALRSAKMESMEQAAVAVLLPMISHNDKGDGQELHFKTKTASEYSKAIQNGALEKNRMPEGDLKFAQIVICGPTKSMLRNGTVRTPGGGDEEYDFDDATNATSGDWEQFERTKLFIQVTFNYRMSIPFANMMLYMIARGQEKAEVMWVARMTPEQTKHFLRDYEDRNPYDALAQSQQIYVLPIRASWGTRMHSNLFPATPGYEMPTASQCYVPFPKKGESDPGGAGSGTSTVGDNPDEEGAPQ